MPLPTKWYWEYLTPDLVLLSNLQGIVYSGQTRYQRVEILETAAFGRCLVLDGKTQSTEADEFVYHEALVHPPLVLHQHPQRVLIAGGGEGATLREVLKHKTVQEAVMVDLDREVVNLCRQHLPRHHAGAFDDSRVQLHHADALAFLEAEQRPYDVVILDVPDPLEGGHAYLLYTQEFYRLVRSRLNGQGVVVVQAGFAGPTTYGEEFTAIHATVSTVFPTVAGYRVYIPSFGGMWGFVIGSLDQDPAALTTEEVDRRLADRLTGDLRYYDGVTHRGIFALPKYLRKALAEEQRIITRENPLFVY